MVCNDISQTFAWQFSNQFSNIYHRRLSTEKIIIVAPEMVTNENANTDIR